MLGLIFVNNYIMFLSFLHPVLPLVYMFNCIRTVFHLTSLVK